MQADRGKRFRSGGRLSGIVAVLVLSASCVSDVAPPRPESTLDGSRELRSDAVLLVLDEKLPGCSAAVGIDGVVAWSGSRGLANLTTGEQLTATTVYDIGSGAGIVVQDDRSLVHSGGSDGFRTLFVVLPDQHTTVAVSCNYSKLAPEPLENMHQQLREIWS